MTSWGCCRPAVCKLEVLLGASWLSCTHLQTVTAFLEKFVEDLLAEHAISANGAAAPKLPLVRSHLSWRRHVPAAAVTDAPMSS